MRVVALRPGLGVPVELRQVMRVVALLFGRGLLPQPHARPAAILRDEFDAGRFKGGADRGHCAVSRSGVRTFNAGKRAFCGACRACKLRPAPPYQRASGPKLGRVHVRFPDIRLEVSGNMT